MEEWVGRQWHRFIVRASEQRHRGARVCLPEVERSVQLMFRAAGGGPTVRIATAGARTTGHRQGLLQRIAATGTRTAVPVLQPDALCLPPEIDAFEDSALNRGAYLWLAALAAHLVPGDDWIQANVTATAAALASFPGLTDTYRCLVEAHLKARPNPDRMRTNAATAERQIQRALRTQALDTRLIVQSSDVSPVAVWLDWEPSSPRTGLQRPDGDSHPASAADPQPAQADRTRRRAEAIRDERHQAPLMMFFRAESILSWGDFVRVNRPDDNDESGDPSAAADDMDALAVAPDGNRTASRIRFDLDLPSAACDDQPLGPGTRQPEWDYRHNTLLPDHCSVQCLQSTDTTPMHASPRLRATARRVRRKLETLRGAWGLARARDDGEELDLDAWLRHSVDAGRGPRECAPAVWTRRVRNERSLATLLLADLSLSTDAYVGERTEAPVRVIDVIRDALYVFGEALSSSGNPFEMLGFSSARRQNVRIHQLKTFDEGWHARTQSRVGAIRPGYYTRMGAAIRFASARLALRPERQRLLLILTDGKPNDLDIYEGRYGLEDTRHAVHAARALGLVPYCVTIDESAHEYLPTLFGEHGWALVHRPRDLVHRLAGIHARLTRGNA